MSTTRAWIEAFRLRTLPLSFSCILLGTLLAASKGRFDLGVLLLSLMTTLFIQILSNLANDYGDGIKGTDNTDRIGPQRAVQSGVISPQEMKRGIILFSLLTLVTGILLTYWGTRRLPNWYFWGFVGVGLVAIWAAIQYTVGKRAYGYFGLGDLFVFLFFGLVGVLGSYFLHTNAWDSLVLLPAAAVGMLCVGVLNINNMRDIESDTKAGKNTLAVKMGILGAKRYHSILLVGAMVLAFLFVYLSVGSGWKWIFLISLAPILLNLRTVSQIQNPKAFDPLLKQLAISTLLFSVLMGLGQLL